MGDGYHDIQEQETDTSEQCLQEQEEYCAKAAHDIANYVETGGLADFNSLLEKRGYKLIRLSDVVPV